MLKLYEFEEEIERLIDEAIDSETGEIKSETLLEAAGQLQLDRKEKILGMAAVCKSIRAEIKAYDEEIKAMRRRKDARVNSLESLKSYMSDNMEAGEKLKDGRVSIYWQTSTSVKLDVEASELPEEFQRVTVDANKTALKDFLQKGAEVPGASLETKQGLAIR